MSIELTDNDTKDLRFLQFTDVAPYHIAAFGDWEQVEILQMLAKIPAARNVRNEAFRRK